MSWLLVAVLFLGQVKVDSLTGQLPNKSPGRAVLFSLIFPGGGQVYTHNYWRAAVIAAAEVGLGGLAYQEHTRMKQAWAALDTTGYYFHRDRRTTFLWWTAGVVVFSMADAYVSAQMFGFDQEMRLDLGPTLPLAGGECYIRLGFQLAWR
jgi:hypothetical protein